MFLLFVSCFLASSYETIICLLLVFVFLLLSLPLLVPGLFVKTLILLLLVPGLFV